MSEDQDQACRYAILLGRVAATLNTMIWVIKTLNPDGLPKWADVLIFDAESLIQEVLREQ